MVLKHQSPINVTLGSIRVDPALPPLRVHYGRADLELTYRRRDADKSNGCATRHPEETEEAEVPLGAAHVTLGGVRYDLRQFHFHTPAEHRFLGRVDPMEMHLVHENAVGERLAIGVPLRVGQRSTVDDVLARLAPECGPAVTVPDVDLATLLPVRHTTLRYQGSLTTDPYTEGVRWFLMAGKTVTAATVARFRCLFASGNSRPVQPLDGRTVVEVPQV
ncbi:carbonic anhydrase [Actinokineospora iranica]|uniref:carbonic anhydrase n=2 Tax=Actinokineospora iranica TaxID=1271860 RepID=A0A1G6JYP5_9PSEU|nr:carbonic anhydrase [Actinokineospora iranica]